MSTTPVPIEVESEEAESGPLPHAFYLDYSENNVIVDGRSQGYRIYLKAKVKTGFQDANVFRYQKISDDEALFTGICSPADIVDYSTNPNPRDGFFRRDVIDLIFPSQSQAYEIRDEIIEELRILCCECFRIANSNSVERQLEVSSDD